MDEDILYSAPPSKSDEELEKGFVTAIIDQPKLLDELARQLVTLNLAIPGLYATALKLLAGDDAVVESAAVIVAAFACWFVALVLSFTALVPRTWAVDRLALRHNKPAVPGQPLSIEEFFRRTATYKRRLLIAATACCFIGICCACIAMFMTTNS